MDNEPSPKLSDPKGLLLGYLAYYRRAVLRKLEGLSEEDLNKVVVPSGWTPLELLNHLIHMERRWLHWGFAGNKVPDPWADHHPETQEWVVPQGASLAELAARLEEIGRLTEDVTADARLVDRGRLGGRWDDDPPPLSWILLHVLQEYARHAGHLDVVRELIDGSVGE
jgi:uncharacterized damage-inducible protein DinB